MFERPIAAFDIETIPDPDVGRRVMGLQGSDREVVQAMVEQRESETEGRSQYPQLPFHRVVIVGIAWLDPATKRFKLGTVAGDAMDEKAILEGFFNMLARSHKPPRLVSWNGGGFDVPVMRYRAMLHGIQAPEFYRKEGEWKWNNYHNRYHDMHVDLMQVLAGFGASTFQSLERVCSLLGIPAKEFIQAPLYEHVLDDDVDTVKEYCKLDCLSTLLVFLNWTLHTGQLSRDMLSEFLVVIKEAVAAEEHATWASLSSDLERWPPFS
jgi:3'-5' exonuclease